MLHPSDSPLALRLSPFDREQRLLAVTCVMDVIETAGSTYVRACDERLVSDCLRLFATAFDAAGMELIDSALSRSTLDDVLPRLTSLAARLAAVEFGRAHEWDSDEGHFFDGAGCLRAIAGNIRENNGMFVPPRMAEAMNNS